MKLTLEEIKEICLNERSLKQTEYKLIILELLERINNGTKILDEFHKNAVNISRLYSSPVNREFLNQIYLREHFNAYEEINLPGGGEKCVL